LRNTPYPTPTSRSEIEGNRSPKYLFMKTSFGPYFSRWNLYPDSEHNVSSV
jgi:hypothetical protein